MLTDSHCHLFYDEILQDIDNVFVRSKKLGVNRYICVGTNINDSLLSLDISKKFEKTHFKLIGMDSDKCFQHYIII